jgi:hypothetical protein
MGFCNFDTFLNGSEDQCCFSTGTYDFTMSGPNSSPEDGQVIFWLMLPAE